MKVATMIEALLKALAAGIALALMSGPLGCVIVWRRMAYFGDAMAHAALLGVALSLLSDILPLPLMVLMVTLVSALLLGNLTHDARLHADTALGMIAHGALATGIVLISVFSNEPAELEHYLIGDILSISWQQAGLLWVAALAICGVCSFYWRPILMVVLDDATARLHGVAVERMERLLVLAMAVLVALAIPLVGVLLITAMLIIPAAAAGNIARAPKRMAMIATMIAFLAVVSGLAFSVVLDTPPAPTMVASAVMLFIGARACCRD